MKLTEKQWQEKLTAEQYNICRCQGTEMPFSGEYVNCKKKGIYHCRCCQQPLFDSEAKYDSGSGWPSYWQAISDHVLIERGDDSLAMSRVEVLCAECEAHLGHVFNDGPQPTGLRYCINSLALVLDEK